MVSATSIAPWEPLEVELALATLQGLDEVLIIGSESMSDHLGIDVMARLRETMEKDSKR